MAEQGKFSLELLIEAQDQASEVITSLEERLKGVNRAVEEVNKSTGEGSKKSSSSMLDFSGTVTQASKEVEKLAEGARESVDLFDEFADYADEKFEVLGEVISNTSISLDELSGILAGIGFQALSLGAALVAPFILGIKASSDFEDAMRAVRASTEGAEESFDKLSDTAIKLGTTTRFSVKEAAEAMATLGKEGFNASEVLTAIGPTLDLAAAQTYKIADAAKLTATVMRALQAPVSETGEILDVLVNTANSSTISVKELAEAIGGSSAGAVRAGQDIEELAAIIATLHEAGIEGERATRALNDVMLTMAAPTKEARNALDDLGVEIQVSADGSIDLVKAFEDLADAGINVAEATEIFGSRTAHAVVAMTSQTDALEKLILSNRAALGSTEKMADIMGGTLKQSVNQLFDALNRLQLFLGKGLVPIVVKVVNGFTSLVNSIADLLNAFPVLSGVVTNTTLVLGGLLLVFGGLSLAMSGFLKGIAILKSSAIASVFTSITAAVAGTGAEVAKTAGSLNFLVLAMKEMRLALSLNVGLFGVFKGVLITIKEALIAVAARIRGLFAASALNPVVAFIAVLGLAVVALFEWDKRLDAAIDKNRELGNSLGDLNTEFGKQMQSLNGMKKGSKEYNAEAKNLETRLLKVAEENESLAEAAYKAADAIDDETGAIKEGSTAIEDFAQAAREVELDVLEEQVSLLGERFKRLKGEGGVLSETLQGIKIVSRGLFAAFTGGDPSEVLREIDTQAKAVKLNMERAAIATLAQFKAYDEVDMDASAAEMEVFFTQIRGESAETTEVFLAAFDKMQKAAQDTTLTARQLENFSSAEVVIELDKNIEKVQALAEEYRIAAAASELAAGRGDEDAADKVAERIAASKKLAANEKETNDLITSLKKKSDDELKQSYDDELFDLDRRKKLEIDKEWEYNLKKAALDESYAASKVKNLQSIVDQADRSNARELDIYKTLEKELLALKRQRTRESKNNADAQILHANQVKDAILDIKNQTADIELNLLPTTQDTYIEQAKADIADLYKNAKDVGIQNETVLAKNANAIRAKYHRQWIEYKEGIDQQAADSEVALAQEMADRQVKVLEDRFNEQKIGPSEYVAGATKAQTAVLDLEIAELKRRLEVARDELKDAPLVVDIKFQLASVEAEKKAIIEDQEKLIREAKYAREKAALDAEATVIETKLAGTGGGLDDMNARDQLELDALANKQAARRALMVQAFASDKELADQALADEKEREQLSLDLYKDNWEAKLSWSADMAGTMADAFGKMYEITGKKSKEWFYAQKAAALAEATMQIAKGVSTAWGQGGMYGAIGAAIVASAGAVQLATIAAQGLAEGGQVKGSSPTKKSDNIPAWLTAREFVHPVDTVDYYGTGVMEAMRKRLIPKEIFSGYQIPVVKGYSGRRFAEGGMASQDSSKAMSAPPQQQQTPTIDIVNVVDQSMMEKYISSTSGKQALFNVIRSNSYEMKNALATEM